MNIIKHKQQACKGKCGKSFEDITAGEMNGIHFDHRTGTIKNTKYQNSCNYRKDTPAEAVIEWTKCESVCAGYHDQGMGAEKGPGDTVKAKKK